MNEFFAAKGKDGDAIFVHLSVLAYDGSSMRQVDAGEGVGLYSTVLSRADYDSLSGKTGGRLAASVTPDYKPSR